MKTFPFPGYDLLLPDIVRAENCSLFDAAGNRWVDLESGVWCTSVGHGNPAVKQALAQQMDAVAHVGFSYSSPVVEEAAGAIQALLGHEGGRCAFLCSGSEAVEYGVRVLRALTDGDDILALADSYFGAYGDAAARTEGWAAFDWSGCEGCGRDACTDACPRFAFIPFDRIKAFLFEPGSSSGLVRFPPAQLISAIVDAVRGRGGLFMVNEVTTGVGRTGTWFGHQHYGVTPDIAALGKGIGNGYPVSVASLNARVADRLGNEPIHYGQSHLNDPLGAAVALAVVREITEKRLIERAAMLSSVLLPGLEAVADRSPHPAVARGRGLMAVLDLAMAPEDAAALHARLVREGFVCGLRPHTAVLRMDPALTIDEHDLRAFLDALAGLTA